MKGHTSVQQGKKVMVHLKNGEKIVAKFKEKKGEKIIFYDYETIGTNIIRTISIYKHII